MVARNFMKNSQLGRLYAVLCVTLLFFAAELVVSHITHSLTLLVDAYHMLCNLLALTGCIVTIKLCQRPRSVSNTFGWARLEVLAMLVDIMFLGALCFSVSVEAIQTVVHADHQDAMHHPIPVGVLGLAGVLVNGLCIIIIGGYTHHQGSFVNLDSKGNVILESSATEDAVRRGMRRLSTAAHHANKNLQENQSLESKTETKGNKRWPSLFACIRDITSSLLVITVSVIVYLDEEGTAAFYVDPALAVVSVLTLMATSYPFMLQAGRILLQTIPDHIDVNELRSKITENFSGIVNVHDLHVWALTPTKIYLTAHILFVNKQVYAQTAAAIEVFFQQQGITHVTLQPEFFHHDELTPAPSKGCILTCSEDSCAPRQCCSHCVKLHAANCEDVETGVKLESVDPTQEDREQVTEELLPKPVQQQAEITV